jgi:hypothetical protein
MRSRANAAYLRLIGFFNIWQIAALFGWCLQFFKASFRAIIKDHVIRVLNPRSYYRYKIMKNLVPMYNRKIEKMCLEYKLT